MEFHNANSAAFRQETLVELSRKRAVQEPEKIAYIFLQDGEGDELRISYAELDRRARAVAAQLQNLGATGERALLLYPAGLDFIVAYFGCLYAGVTAVPVYPPRLNRPSPRIQGIVADAQARFTLTTTQILEKLERRFAHMPDLAALRWLNTDTLPDGLDEQWRDPGVTADTLAFLQYTSGSTSAPKGVMVSHGNLMHNLELIRRGFRIDHRGSGVFWLPSYHDMGLIGGILEPMYITGFSVLMDPAAFLQRPVRWLQALSRYKGTISGAPNFAYQMCVDKVTPEQCERLDLSQWEIAFSGAEPIRPETLDAFAERFAPYGFSREAFYPCYGLAEGTLIVSGGDGTAAPVPLNVSGAELTRNRAVLVEPGAGDAQALISSGHALLDQRIVIADPDAQTACAPGAVGEIWVSGDSVAKGYWNRPEATQETFQAFLAGSGEGPFLRTGDLGFLHEGELYITGRLKDLIIIRGRNHYPQDIEQTVNESHEAFETGMGAAFSVEIDGEEQLVITFELKRSHRRADADEVAAAARRAVATQHGLQAHTIVLLKPLSIPRTTSGKIKRHACRQGFLDGSLEVIAEWQQTAIGMATDGGRQSANSEQPAAAGGSDRVQIEQWLIQQIAAQLRIPADNIVVTRPFVDFGLDSVQAVSLTGELESWLGRALPATLVWDYPTIRDLATHLSLETGDSQSPISPERSSVNLQSPVSNLQSPLPIAIISLACRFPGAPDPEAFWRLLHDGVDAIAEIPADRWDAGAYFGENGEGAAPGKMNTRWGGFLDRVDLFDPHFFGISPREAERMDPQQRLMLEVAWEALERAGRPASQLAGSRTGVFVGISSYDYSRLQMGDPGRIDAYAGTGNAHSVAANRLSYIFDFRGPSVAVDTACSSALVAVHLALQSLRSGESELALAGGVNLILTPELTITFSQARMMAADGRCKTFDANADGYVRGEGAGVVVLKRLEDAVRDGDPVLAVLYGSAVNQDGRSNGLTAPNGHAQQAVIRQALNNAGVSTADLDYVEAHGTGTPLGDPIEVQALRAALEGGLEGGLSGDGEAPPRCFLGSVKTNIGHLEAAAGIAGLIKVVLALQHGAIPPHLHFKELNPYIALDDSPLSIAEQRQPWPRGDRPRLAGVSSFGFGGTNAHVVVGDQRLEIDRTAFGRDWGLEIGGRETGELKTTPFLLPLSAKSEPALIELAARYAAFVEERDDVSLNAICYTAAAGREHFQHRATVVAPDRARILQQLREISNLQSPISQSSTSNPKVAYLFTGQGAQFPGMARRLYETQPIFRSAMDRCAVILRDYLDEPLLGVIFGELESGELKTRDSQSPISNLLDHTAYTQPALFAVEYALAQLWRSWGVEPDVVIGHSVGEYVAACVAGVFSLEDGLRLIAARGRLMQSLPREGSMAVVFASRQRVETALASYAGTVAVAAVNGAESVTISGETAAVEVIVAALAKEGVESRALTVSHAFHSPLMDPILDTFEEEARAVAYHAPRIKLISNVTGQPFDNNQAPDAAYWRRHVRQPVEFVAGVHSLLADGANTFLEIGPQPHLLSMVQRIIEQSGQSLITNLLPSLRRNKDEVHTILEALASLYCAGLEINWPGVYAGRPRPIVSLPTYPFQRQRYWLDVEEFDRPFPAPAVGSTSDVRRLPTALPLYEATLHAGDGDAVRRLLDAAAADYWDEGQHQLLSLILDPGANLNGPATLQLAFASQNAALASVQLFRFDADQARWLLCGSAQIQRGAAPVSASGRVEGKQDGSEAAVLSLHQRLLALAEGSRAELAGQFLQQQAAQVLGLTPADLSRRQPLDGLGMDSLMAIELRNRIESELRVTLPVVNFLQGPSVDDLVAQVLAHLREPDGERLLITACDYDPHSAAPLSYGQQAMWFLHQLLPADITFNVAGAVRLRGALDVHALRRALQTVVQRHSSLRMTYTIREGQPVQQLSQMQALPIEEIDARAWRNQRLQSYLEQEAHRPFDLENGPLLRLKLLQRGPQEHVLLLSVSHMATDFWSMSLLVQELTLAYQAFAAGRTLLLPPLSIDYVDYVYWQRQMLAGEEGQRLRDYWLKQLGGELPLLDLPTDRPRPAQQTFYGDTTSRRLSPELAQALRELAREHGATLATTLLAGFQALLHRYTGQEDLLVGSVFSGRERPELSPLAGYFINPVALRADFSGGASQAGGPTFAAFLQQARQTMLDAFAHQDYPLALLAEQLSLQRDPGRPPIFETMFIMQKAQVMDEQGLSALALGLTGAHMEIGDLSAESVALAGLPAQFDLTLMMAEVQDGLAAALHYNTALFDGGTADRMLVHLERLLQRVVADPDQPLARIPLLSAGERRLLRDWNQTTADYPRDRCLHELIQGQVARTPRAVAVSGAGQSLTYEALNRRANQLAHHLQSQGVGPDDLVGVALDRSPQMVVALLGVLKAGGAYVPLDPAFPAARLELMVEDAQPRVILTQQHLLSEMPGTGVRAASTQIVCLDRDWPAIAAAPDYDPESQVTAENLAYVIYTSGSTGRPKGVQISHRAVVNFLTSMQREPGLVAGDVLLAVTTLSFDIAVLELYLPLISGAQVVIAAAEVSADGTQLLDLLQASGATVMQATPATWRMLLASGWEGKSDLKILCGGEALPRDLAQALLARCGELWNMYGPTETTVWSTTSRICDGDGLIPIGRPIANTQIYILDDAGHPLPAGIAGELYIGGDGVARGYLNRPDLTAEKFVTIPGLEILRSEDAPLMEPAQNDGYQVYNPQAPISPERSSVNLRVYRTGDLARYDARGNIYFLGRRDQQVKVRGYRIELGDVEAALGRHPLVSQAVVVARGHGGARRLVAYLLLHDGAAAPDASDLRHFLRQKLPDYMVPSTFVTLDELPLTPNNKVDRRALPAPPDGRPETADSFVAPQTPLETELAQMCAAVLNLAEDVAVGIHDNFFDLGGTSLLATQLIFQVRERFQAQIPLRQLFAEPTVAGLARAIENGVEAVQDNWHMTVEQLNAEAQLDPDIKAGHRRYEPPVKLQNVLLTGATGFLGAFLLRDLLQKTPATVHCLVRAADSKAGLQRLRRNLMVYELWDEAFARRIMVVPGDLAEPRLGLNHDDFRRLAGDMDAIIHNGALVNFVYPYVAHKPANVLGTQEVLRLAATARLQPVHFVSTLSVFHTGQHDDGTIFAEEDDLDLVGAPFGGYAQSKWVAEKLVLEAGRRGIPTAIYRPGLVSGAAATGAWNTEDMMTTLAHVSLAAGVVPDLDEGDKETQVDVVPVDYVSAAIVQLVQQNDSASHFRAGIFHLNNTEPLPYGELLALMRSLGIEAQVVTFAEWRRRLAALALQAGGNGATPFLPLLEEVTAEQVFMPTFDCRNTTRGLQGSGISCPPVGPRLLHTYFAYFRRKGLLPDFGARAVEPVYQANGNRHGGGRRP